MASYITYVEVIIDSSAISFKERLNEYCETMNVKQIEFTNTKHVDRYGVEEWHYEAIVIVEG